MGKFCNPVCPKKVIKSNEQFLDLRVLKSERLILNKKNFCCVIKIIKDEIILFLEIWKQGETSCKWSWWKKKEQNN